MLIRDTAGQDRPLERSGKKRARVIALGLSAAAVAAAIAGVLVLGSRWLSGERSVDAARLRIAEVTRGTLVRDVAVEGRVVAAVSPTLYAPLPGTVTLAINAGDTVKKGDVLAKIDSPELAGELQRERAMHAQVEAQLGSARIAAGRRRLDARREMDEAAIALMTAERELQRMELVWKQKLVPEVEYLAAKDALETARVREANAREAAKLANRSAAFDAETAAQQLERQKLAVAELERRVAELTVRAPVDGVVGTLSVGDRAAVPANTPLLTLVDLSRLEVDLIVPETYADDLGLGMRAELELGGAKVAGTIAALSPEVVNHNVVARMRFSGAQPPGLRQSQRVSARIVIDERAAAVKIARGPFLETHGARHAYVVIDGVAVRRAIRVGATSVSDIEILSGLEPGDRVVIAGSESFADAETVRIND